jgi:DNA-binding HxlR family transcriptional regulator
MKKATTTTTRIAGRPPVSDMVQSIVGDKWTLSVLTAIRSGIDGPAEIERACPGISTKMLNERLREMLRFGIIERESVGEAPPRVEYRLTGLGGRFVRLIDDIDELQRAVDTGTVELRGTERKPRRKKR